MWEIRVWTQLRHTRHLRYGDAGKSVNTNISHTHLSNIHRISILNPGYKQSITNHITACWEHWTWSWSEEERKYQTIHKTIECHCGGPLPNSIVNISLILLASPCLRFTLPTFVEIEKRPTRFHDSK